MIIIKRYETIALIDRKIDFNSITILLILKIKGYLRLKYKLNIKKKTIE